MLVIVLLSMAVGYWMKKPYKVYVRGGNGNKSKRFRGRRTES